MRKLPWKLRAPVAVGLFAVLVTIGSLVLARDDTKDAAPSDAIKFVENAATIECKGSTVQLDFDPGGRIAARVGGVSVAWADASRRGLNRDACARVTTQRGWDTRTTYWTRSDATTLTCHLPGRFSVHVHPVSPSWAGGRPAGSAVYLVLGRRVGPGTGPNRTIVASAAVIERSDESDLAFAPAYCSRS